MDRQVAVPLARSPMTIREGTFRPPPPKEETGAQVFAIVFRALPPLSCPNRASALRDPSRATRSLDVARLRVSVQVSTKDFSMLHHARTKWYW